MFGNKDKNPGILPLTLETVFAYIYEVKLIKALILYPIIEVAIRILSESIIH